MIKNKPKVVTVNSAQENALFAEPESQINVPPSNEGSLWKVIVPEIRCPKCGSSCTKARTGKRLNRQGLSEHYRECNCCKVRFKVVFE